MSAASTIVSAAKQAASFVETVTSGRVTDQELERRLAICGGCDKMKREGDGMYCAACNCPEWVAAELKTKTRFEGAACPLAKW